MRKIKKNSNRKKTTQLSIYLKKQTIETNIETNIYLEKQINSPS